MTDVKVTAENIRAFAAHTLPEEAVDHFLDSQVHVLITRNLHAKVMEDILPSLMSVGLIIGFEPAGVPECVALAAWIPFDHSHRIMSEITERYKHYGMENPYQHYDFENMDKAWCGKDYVRFMLEGAAREGQDIS